MAPSRVSLRPMNPDEYRTYSRASFDSFVAQASARSGEALGFEEYEFKAEKKQYRMAVEV